jgi:uncharacterized protein
MTDELGHEFTRGLYGWITHTELSSTDPEATRQWCAVVLGWKFQPPFPSPAGDCHLFAYSESGGGGIRHTAPGESPGSTPTVHVEDTQAAYDAAWLPTLNSAPPHRSDEAVVCARAGDARVDREMKIISRG